MRLHFHRKHRYCHNVVYTYHFYQRFLGDAGRMELVYTVLNLHHKEEKMDISSCILHHLSTLLEQADCTAIGFKCFNLRRILLDVTKDDPAVRKVQTKKLVLGCFGSRRMIPKWS